MCSEIGPLDPSKVFSAHEIPWQAVLEKTKIKLELLTYIDMLDI